MVVKLDESIQRLNWEMSQQLSDRDCSTTESWVADITLSLEQLLVGVAL